ncbi:MAG TPA: hypothetical protein ENJ94_10580 [Gammaproteobacteria bacterium]|nr:hypothetical protein [Gammaproteobacteria bacterium]
MSGRRPWGDSFRLHYHWHQTAPEPCNCGTGTIHYDAVGRRYALHNRFANAQRRLGYVLDEAAGVAHVFEWRDGRLACHRHRTDRQVRLADQVAEGVSCGQGLVPGGEVRFVEFREPGDHDRWLWCLDDRDRPLRFFTWTHRGAIQVLHDLDRLEAGVAPDEAAFRPPADCEG